MQYAVVAVTACYGAQANSGIGRALQCRPGTRQQANIVLGCAGGSTETQITLAPAGSSGSSMSWHVAQGTRDLYVAVNFSPMTGLTGDADLAASCNRTQMVGKLGTILTPDVVKSHIVGADWAWSGDDSTVPIHEWLSVKGSMACDLTLYMQNRASTALSGTVSYSWAGVFPCPDLLPGCVQCYDSQCPVNSTVICDGSVGWSCSQPADSGSQPPLVGNYSDGFAIPNFPPWFYALLVCVMFLMFGAACLPAIVSRGGSTRRRGRDHKHTRSLDLHGDEDRSRGGMFSSNPYGEAMNTNYLPNHDYLQNHAAVFNPGVFGAGPNPFLNGMSGQNQYLQMPPVGIQPYGYAEVPSNYGPAGPPPY